MSRIFTLHEYDLIQSIPGIRTKIAATTLAEIEKIDQLNHARKLAAFAGIERGTFVIENTAI